MIPILPFETRGTICLSGRKTSLKDSRNLQVGNKHSSYEVLSF